MVGTKSGVTITCADQSLITDDFKCRRSNFCEEIFNCLLLWQLFRQSLVWIMDRIVRFTNCQVLRGGKLVKEDLWVRGGRIVDPRPLFYGEKLRETEVVDCQDGIVAPGFIDVQINGAFGYDFSSSPDTVAESLRQVAKRLLECGVTSFCPTIVTSSPETYHALLPQIERTEGGKGGAAIVGVHLEGPFISREKKGAHSEEHIWSGERVQWQDIEECYGDLSNASIITVAPERNGLDDCTMIHHLCEKQIIVSLGHSTANLSEAKRAVDCGARFITHLFNAMLPFHHRDPGLVGLLTTRKNTFYGIIADGVHTDMAAVHLAYHSHPQGLVLVSDAMAAAGLGVGRHNLGPVSVDVTQVDDHLQATLADNPETLAGSAAMLDFCVQWFWKASQCSEAQALETASAHPAKLLNLHQKGSLDFDMDADIVVLDKDLKVCQTFIAGEQVWPEKMEM